MPPKTFAYGGINYQLSAYNATGFDNILVKGQTIDVPRGKYFSIRCWRLPSPEWPLAQ